MSTFIFNKYLEDSSNTNQKIEEFLNKSEYYLPNIVNTLNFIPNYNIIIYTFIVFSIYALFKNRNIKINDIFILLISVIIIYILIQKDQVNFIKFNDNKKIQIKFLEKLMFSSNNYSIGIIGGESLSMFVSNKKESFLYFDPVIIEFYYNIREFINYDISAYINSLKASNNLLKLCYQADKLQYNLKENFEQVIIEKNNALNHLSYLTFRIPKDELYYKKYRDSINILHERLNAHIENMSILFKNVVKSKNKTELYYLPTDTFEMSNTVQPYQTNFKKIPIIDNLY